MKRMIFLALVFAVLFCGCGISQGPVTADPNNQNPAVSVEPIGDEHTFLLSALPQIGAYQPLPSPRRWYEGYTDHLIPSDEYGELIPYLGTVRQFTYEEYDGTVGVKEECRYGLCTIDGVIVTDPVYTRISDGEEGYYVLRSSETEGRGYTYCIAKTDGSRVAVPDVSGFTGGYVGNGIYAVGDLGTRNRYFDRTGREITDHAADDYDMIYMVGDVMVLDDADQVPGAFVLDEQLQLCSDAVDWFAEGAPGQIVFAQSVADPSLTRFGIMSKTGEILISADYSSIVYENERYFLQSGLTMRILNDRLELIRELHLSDLHVRILGGAVIEAGVTDPDYCDIMGNPLNADRVEWSFNSGCLILERDGQTVIADSDLNEIARIPLTGISDAIPLTDRMLVLGQWQGYSESYCLYDLETEEVTESGLSYWYGRPACYCRWGEGTGCELFTAEGKNLGWVDSFYGMAQIANGTYYYYARDGVHYTADANGRIITGFADAMD